MPHLKIITRSDIHYIHKGLSNPKVTKYYAVHFPSLEATEEQMDWHEGLIDKDQGI